MKRLLCLFLLFWLLPILAPAAIERTITSDGVIMAGTENVGFTKVRETFKSQFVSLFRDLTNVRSFAKDVSVQKVTDCTKTTSQYLVVGNHYSLRSEQEVSFIVTEEDSVCDTFKTSSLIAKIHGPFLSSNLELDPLLNLSSNNSFEITMTFMPQADSELTKSSINIRLAILNHDFQTYFKHVHKKNAQIKLPSDREITQAFTDWATTAVKMICN